MTEFIKDRWGDGPWLHEPDSDKMAYKDITTIFYRNRYGVWCGYIFAPKECVPEDTDSLHVHGGITYQSDDLRGENAPKGLTIIGFDCYHYEDYAPQSLNNPLWRENMANELLKAIEDTGDEKCIKLVLDMQKLYSNMSVGDPSTYKTLEFAKEEARKLIDQLADK